MKPQTKEVQVSKQKQVISTEQANNLLKQMMNDKGSFRQNTTLTLPLHNWQGLQNGLKQMLELPLFQVYVYDWMLDIERTALQIIYNENNSWAVKVSAYHNIFNKDLIMDAITHAVGTSLINYPKFCEWKPFGGEEFYYSMKDAWYSNTMTNSFLHSSVRNVIQESKSKLIKDPQLPFLTDVNPRNITVHMVDVAKMQMEHERHLINCELETQVGLHGTDAFWNKKQNKPNKNWDLLMDLALNPLLEFDRANTNHQVFPTGFSPKNKDDSSKAINKLSKALSHIFKLADGYNWFTKSGDTYKPNFSYTNSIFSTIQKTSHMAQNEKEYDAYADRSNAEWGHLDDTRDGLYNNEKSIPDNNVY